MTPDVYRTVVTDNLYHTGIACLLAMPVAFDLEKNSRNGRQQLEHRPAGTGDD